MRLNGLIDLVLERLKAQPSLSQVKFTKAYPNKKRNAKLKTPTVAVGIAEINGENSSLDEEQLKGGLSVFFDIFVPLSMASDKAIDIFSFICEGLFDLSIVGISSQEITGSRLFGAYVLKTKITFDDRIIAGGEDNE